MIPRTARRTRRAMLVATVLFAILLLTAFALSVSATPADFIAAVDAIPADGTYAARRTAIIQAENAYAALSEEERGTVTDAYEKLDAATRAQNAFSARADAFIAAANALRDITDITDEIESIDYLLSDEARVDDVTYPGIEETLATLNRRKAELGEIVTACETFIDAVDRANDLAVDLTANYRGTRAALAEAETVLAKARANRGYPRVSEAIATYQEIEAQLTEIEETNESFLNKVRLMQAASTYEDMASYYEAATIARRNLTVTDYDGISEADIVLEEANRRLNAMLTTAGRFLVAVQELTGDRVTFASLCDALTLYQTVDETVPGVADAYHTLDLRIRDYNRAAASANEAMEREHNRVPGLIF